MRSQAAIIARLTETGWEGRYVHVAGAPDRMVPVLRAIHARDGLGVMARTLIDAHGEWGRVDDDQGGYCAGAATPVVGYGLAYPVASEAPLTSAEGTGARWVYLLSENGVEVLDMAPGINDSPHAWRPWPGSVSAIPRRREAARGVWVECVDKVLADLRHAVTALERLREPAPATDPFGDGVPDYAAAAADAAMAAHKAARRVPDLTGAARRADRLARHNPPSA